jgi:hypothetical protein
MNLNKVNDFMRALKFNTPGTERTLLMPHVLIERQAGALEAIIEHLAKIEDRLDRLASALEDHLNHAAPPF